MAVPAMVATSSPCRTTSACAMASPVAATRNSTGASSAMRRRGSAPKCRAMLTASTVGSPKWSATARDSAVGRPRPSSPRAADGRTVRFPALGELTGDWGGGQHLGSLALWHAARAEDGRGPDTALVAAIAAHFGRPGIAEVGAAVHFGDIARDRIGELAPVLFRVAATGDAIAANLVAQQGEEVAVIAATAIRRLDLLGSPVTVVLGGGVLRARDPILFGALTERLTAIAPAAEIVLVTDPPVLGAALLALDAVGAESQAHQRLRREIKDNRSPAAFRHSNATLR